MKTRLVVIYLFIFISTGTLFAQQNKGFIRSSFSHGIHFISSLSPYATSSEEFRYKDRNGATMDIDFVHSSGFTMGLSAMFLSNDDGSFIFPVISLAGYTYSTDKWCAGAKMLVSAKHLGFNINGTYWLNGKYSFFDNMGFGVVFNMLFSSTSLFDTPKPSEGFIILPALSWSFKF